MKKASKGKRQGKSVEERFVTRAAREAADAAIDGLSSTEPMTTYIDVWLTAYKAAGGIEKK